MVGLICSMDPLGTRPKRALGEFENRLAHAPRRCRVEELSARLGTAELVQSRARSYGLDADEITFIETNVKPMS